MTIPDDTPGSDRSDRPPQLSGRRSRALLAGLVVLGLVVVFGFMLLVSRCGSGDETGDVYGWGPPVATVLAAVS